jgi:MraZ protein
MFAGIHDHVLDDKGRTSLPKEFRLQLAEHAGTPWLTALRDCLAIFPTERFEELRTRLSEASSTIEAVQRMQRLINGMASPCPFDRQGRILIPPKLREWAHLEREIVLTGVGNRIELWDSTRHLEELQLTRQTYTELTRELRDFGL